MPTNLDQIENLHAVPASDVKKRGWRGVMRTLDEKGVVLVTNHDEPEAVIIPVKAYQGLLAMVDQAESRAASELEALRLRFDERLAALRTSDAGDRLRSVTRRPAKLRGKVKAGTRY
jgi:PHD/YefM family antitoxin component YafN of YafNO toxin-antitoxin module